MQKSLKNLACGAHILEERRNRRVKILVISENQMKTLKKALVSTQLFQMACPDWASARPVSPSEHHPANTGEPRFWMIFKQFVELLLGRGMIAQP